ncbi:hypothetical protein CBL_20764, partial [Carabus blaptoides fortunei]
QLQLPAEEQTGSPRHLTARGTITSKTSKDTNLTLACLISDSQMPYQQPKGKQNAPYLGRTCNKMTPKFEINATLTPNLYRWHKFQVTLISISSVDRQLDRR